jgi:Flp pilus assembly CpaE family ATPase
MFDTVTVTYNVQCKQNNKFVLILKHDLSDIREAELLLENCYKLDPNGVYQIVEHWK